MPAPSERAFEFVLMEFFVWKKKKFGKHGKTFLSEKYLQVYEKTDYRIYGFFEGLFPTLVTKIKRV